MSRPDGITPETIATWTAGFEEQSAKNSRVRDGGLERFMASCWLMQQLTIAGLNDDSLGAFARVSGILNQPRPDPWMVSVGLVKLARDATAHERG